uniref:Uncharacterized protein n=2 Tax=Oryza TaxID=4527 RepID=A0A0E0II59_ORYNI
MLSHSVMYTGVPQKRGRGADGRPASLRRRRQFGGDGGTLSFRHTTIPQRRDSESDAPTRVTASRTPPSPIYKRCGFHPKKLTKERKGVPSDNAPSTMLEGVAAAGPMNH